MRYRKIRPISFLNVLICVYSATNTRKSFAYRSGSSSPLVLQHIRHHDLVSDTGDASDSGWHGEIPRKHHRRLPVVRYGLLDPDVFLVARRGVRFVRGGCHRVGRLLSGGRRNTNRMRTGFESWVNIG